MIRTQVYLSKEDIDFLKNQALVDGTTMSDVVRKAIYQTRDISPVGIKVKSSAGDDLLEISQKAKELKYQGPADLASDTDKYLYEDLS